VRSQFEDAGGVVLDAVRDGLTIEDAAVRAGVSVNTVRGWARDGRRNPDGRFGSFALNLDAARVAEPASGPMDLDELREVTAAAARKGSTSAMKLVLDLLRADSGQDRPTDSLSRLDELAAKRQNRQGNAS
jgi:hypothetical protein